MPRKPPEPRFLKADELRGQSRVIDALESEGGYGEKMNNRFKVGIVDLYLTHAEIGPWLVECKAPQPPKTGDEIRFSLTPMQVRCLRRNRDAGGQSAWLVLVKLGQEWRFCAGGLDELHDGEGSVLKHPAQFRAITGQDLLDALSSLSGMRGKGTNARRRRKERLQ